MELILASTSPYRRSLLERLGLEFQAVDPGVDESASKSLGLDPSMLTERLSVAKALAVLRRFPDATVIGADQVAAIDDQILGKPGSHEAAVEQLTRLSGRSHQLVTSTAVVQGETICTHLDITIMTVRRLTRGEIERYLLADRPYDCAGSYKVESRGIALFDSIRSEDHTAIVGLPLIAVSTLLRRLGFNI
ncbi:MAG: nucleoside triphosphate pyrophosphatase [Isosphaeraceae bacterium]|nr:nucleoside triphosphate pyrophosphatase [Isosphaeraceae bacterium]